MARSKGNLRTVCVFTIVLAGASWGAINIQGTVTAASGGQPISGATVTMAKAGLTTTTATNGTFQLTGPTAAVMASSRNGSALSLSMVAGNRLQFHVQQPQHVRVTVVTPQGQTAATLYDRIPDANDVSVSLAALAAGYYVLTVEAGTWQQSIPFIAGIALGNAVVLQRTPETTSMENGSAAGLSKTAAFADTLIVTKTGYAQKRVAVADSVIGGLAITLDASTVPAGMVLIPAKNKTYMMGALPNQGYDDEYPQHQVTLTHDFYMDETEVTQGQYKAMFPGINPSSHKNDTYPVNNITWFDALLYCNKRSKAEGRDTVYSYTGGSSTPTNRSYPSSQSGFVMNQLTGLQIHYDRIGYRLPTEAEWEFAARGGVADKYFFGGSNGSTYPTGTLLATQSQYAWNNGNANGSPHAVKSKLPNPYGLYDIYGNVWEWCNDWALKDNGENAQGGYTAASGGTDPIGETQESGSVQFYFRNFRGGDWSYGSNACNSTFRSGKGTPDFRYIIPGFRCVLLVP